MNRTTLNIGNIHDDALDEMHSKGIIEPGQTVRLEWGVDFDHECVFSGCTGTKTVLHYIDLGGLDPWVFELEVFASGPYIENGRVFVDVTVEEADINGAIEEQEYDDELRRTYPH